MNELDSADHLFHLADRVIGLVALIVRLLATIVIALLVFYCALLVLPHDPTRNTSNELLGLIINLWGQITPYVGQFLRLIAPVFVLLFALGILHRLRREGASPFDASKLFVDLPSTLALLIISTICLLPLAGLSVPDALNNIALVVVGFYFGKRKTSDE